MNEPHSRVRARIDYHLAADLSRFMTGQSGQDGFEGELDDGCARTLARLSPAQARHGVPRTLTATTSQ